MTREEALEQIDNLEETIEDAERTIRQSRNTQAIDAAYETIRHCEAVINQLSQYL